MESFSQKIKNQLDAEIITKKCCRFTDEQMRAVDKCADNSVLLDEIRHKCRCGGCITAFIRRAFILYGSVTDPAKAYHLDFSLKNESEADVIAEALTDAGFDFRRSTRRDRHIIYIKNSTDIEDFLVCIGASGAAFELMNLKIMHEFNNSVNRAVNCDTANIEKQLGSAKKYIEAINWLRESGKIDSLTPELKETAVLRTENDQLSLSELGNMLNPPVSKSGMRHRLDRILETAEKYGFIPEE